MILFFGIFLINFSSAFTINNEIPTSIQLKCDESYNKEFIITPENSENITITPGIITNNNMILALTLHPNTNHLYISLFQNGECMINNKQFTFSINDEDYVIGVNITEDLWDLKNVTMKEGEKVTVGGIAEFSLLTAGSNNILFMLDGCEEDAENFLDIGSHHEATCDGEIVRFEVLDSYLDLEASRILISSSEPGWNVVKGESDFLGEDECELGLETMGAKVKRGNLLGINTINVVNNKKVSSVSVTVLDQTGELSAINAESSNTGFFSQRLHEDYEEDIIVQLEKEGCEPNTQIIQFESSYDDYIKNKNLEENSKTLNFTIGSNYKSGEEFISVVSNLLDEEIEDAEVKITNPSDISSTIKTEFDGSFNFTLNEAGVWKIQVGKANYISSELIEFEVMSSEFIIISLVDDEIKSYFKENDEIIFEMRDENDSIVTRTVTATFGDEEIEFIDGVSEEVLFSKDVSLVIPGGDGFEEYEIKIRVKESKIKVWYVLVAIGILVLIAILISLFSKKSSTSENKSDIGEIGFPTS